MRIRISCHEDQSKISLKGRETAKKNKESESSERKLKRKEKGTSKKEKLSPSKDFCAVKAKALMEENKGKTTFISKAF